MKYMHIVSLDTCLEPTNTLITRDLWVLSIHALRSQFTYFSLILKKKIHVCYQEFADIPGINLKKATVDLNIYVNSLGKII